MQKKESFLKFDTCSDSQVRPHILVQTYLHAHISEASVGVHMFTLVKYWCFRSVSDVGPSPSLPHQLPSLLMYEQIWFINSPPAHPRLQLFQKLSDYIICHPCLSAWFCNSEHNEAQWRMLNAVKGEFDKICTNYKVETIFVLSSLFPQHPVFSFPLFISS